METQRIEQKPERIIPIDDFARQQNISRRTIDRYIRIGKVNARKVKGKTFVVDSPIKPESRQSKNAQKMQSEITQTVQPEEMITKIAQMTKMDWTQFGILTARAKAKRIWQTVAIVSIVCLIAATVAAGWLFSDRQIQFERQVRTLSQVQRKHNQLADQLRAESELLTTENAVLKAQNNLLSSKIESLEASYQNKSSQPVLTPEMPLLERVGVGRSADKGSVQER